MPTVVCKKKPTLSITYQPTIKDNVNPTIHNNLLQNYLFENCMIVFS
ncbi:hypothetical protein CoNPh16_CDS0055 [Staphylococcus phage S-CoN_Ph16]|nr:hypothetical protein CoNPh16_CDS0055 [Staphylococcus phage S-CoN_Ph16]